MIVYILLSITFDKNMLLPSALAFKTKAKCEQAKSTLEKEWLKMYGNATVECTKQKVRE
jgi:hypothetical protein